MSTTTTPQPAVSLEVNGHDFRLGDRVTFTRTLTRHYRPAAPYSRKVWEAEAYPGQPEPAPREGIIVGRRTLANGTIQVGWVDEPTIFIPEERFTAYLVAFDLHRRPVLVLPEHLRPAEAKAVSR